MFLIPKRHFLAQNHVLYVLSAKIGPTAFSVGARKYWKKWSKHSKVLDAYFGYIGGKIPCADWAHFLEEDILDVIPCFKFDDDWFRALASAGVKLCHSPLTLTVVLATLSYYRVGVW